MEERNKNNKNKLEQSGNRFLKDDNHKKGLSQEHKVYLGMDVPNSYFANSKDKILKHLEMEKEQKRTVFGLKPFIAYPIAASILLLVAITFWLQNSNTQNNLKITDVDVVETLNEFSSSDGFLVSSLLVDDTDMDEFMDDFILNEIIVEAERSEQQLENIFINSLFVEDSLINSYINESLIENILL